MLVKLLTFVITACLFQAVVTQMVGGWSNVEDTNSPNFQKIVDFATEKIALELGSTNKMQNIEISSAKQQVVAGMKYKFVMRIGATDCKIGENNDSNCKLKSCGDTHKCSATVWDRPWLNDTRLADFSCDKEEKSCTPE